ncbi:hypothetical protein LTR05_005777 [Lithohypha guttulata]|uniref:P-loop containing nucleoside triphosphate hydrolase protein n=1 Tax=Lithohypha guttulata TaxID=1690604 RepID=A0AAN7Y686_9EURO|nr:hypothetical protein LTR05_005777 [Lithohypha guttulata]
MSSIRSAQPFPDSSSPPPAYTPTVKEVDILLLGSPGTGKSTFLARLPQVRNGAVTSATALERIDLEKRPFTFSVSLFRRPYTFHIWPSTGTLFTDSFPAHPRFVIIAYDVSSRASLHNAQYYWRKQFMYHFDALEHATPVMLLGLKRDLRTDEIDEQGQYVCVMPEEGFKTAIEMRCDKYAECSALTGELLWEAVEDITKTAARTTTDKGGLSEGPGCAVM